MNKLVDTQQIQQVAYKSERAASRRLARGQGLSDEQALRRTLELAAGEAGLAALVAERIARRALDAERAAAREALRAAAKARHEARRQGRHAGPASAWRAWFDGSAHPNPGRCGIGALLKGPDGALHELSQPAGHGNSSEAEYRALIAVLEAALAHGATDLTVYGDSRVVIDDVNGLGAHAAPSLAGYRARARSLLARLPDTTLRWIPRHRNHEADALSQRAVPRTMHDQNDDRTAN